MKITKYQILFIIIILLYSLNSFAMKPYKEYIKTPSDYECEYDSVTFLTRDNVSLVGWYIYSRLPDSKKPTIIFSYGDAGNMSYFLDYANELSKNGFDVFLYDYRGFGQNDEFKWVLPYQSA